MAAMGPAARRSRFSGVDGRGACARLRVSAPGDKCKKRLQAAADIGIL
jgi:hypothetical protein